MRRPYPAVMRYYHYLSANKIDMLYEQIADKRSAGKTEVGVDFKYVKATRGVERSTEASVYEKLAAIEEWIYANEPVGSVDQPDVWVSARVRLVVANMETSESTLGGAVIYATPASGFQEASAIVLGGSRSNVIGEPEAKSAPIPPSAAHTLILLLKKYAHTFADPPMDSLLTATNDWEDDRFADDMWTVTTGLSRTPLHRAYSERSPEAIRLGTCEFLAKRILSTRWRRKSFATLATPLYVALMD